MAILKKKPHKNQKYKHMWGIKDKGMHDCPACLKQELLGYEKVDCVAFTFCQLSEYKNTYTFNFIYSFVEKCKFSCKSCNH